ncbi:MAG: LytR/AlgR family response regulator transcription factor [Cyclobacteriaceae bacterium]
MEIKCIAVDDEPLALKIIEDYVARIPFLKLQTTFSNALDSLEFLKDNSIDLVFLDIQMEGLTGVQLLKVLKNRPLVVFTTAYDSYALQGFELDVVDFLLKPIAFERFLSAVERVHDRLNGGNLNTLLTSIPTKPNDYFFVKTGFKIQKVNFTDIQYIEGQGDYLKIVTIHEKIMTLQSFKELSETLPSSKFVRVHKSYVVGIDHVHSIERNRITTASEIIPVSETYRLPFSQFLKDNGLV